MKSIQRFDPSLVESIQFNIKNVKKYSSLITILLSLIIIAASVIINIDSLKDIYVPRKDLAIQSSNFKNSPQEFSDFPLCITVPPGSAVTATVYLYYYSQESRSYKNKTLQPLNSYKNFTYLEPFINLDNYQCYNLKGVTFKKSDQLRIIGYFPAGTRFIFGTNSLTSVLTQSVSQPLILNDSHIIPLAVSRVFITLRQYILMDRLFINYEPQKLLTFNSEIDRYQASSILTGGNLSEVRFMCGLGYIFKNQAYLGVTYTIIRKNIAEILGGLLAWRGFILIPIGLILILFPIVQELYKLDLIKARYQSQVINNTDFNIFTDIKRRLSRIFPERFPKQKIIDQALQNIEQQLSLIQILQLQNTMRRQRSQFNQIEREQDIFDCKIEQKDIKIDILLQNPDQKTSNEGTSRALIDNKKALIFQKNESKQLPCIVNTLRSLVYRFDTTDIKVSISTNMGKGHGSIWSIVSFVLLAAGVLFVLVLLGLFNFLDDSVKKNLEAIQDNQLVGNLGAYQFAVRFNNPFYAGVPNLKLVDQNLNVLKQIPLVTNSRCLQLPTMAGISTTTWYCTQQQIRLSEVQGNIVRAHIENIYPSPIPAFSHSFTTYEMVIIPESLQAEIVPQYIYKQLGDVIVYHELEKIIKMKDDESEEGFEVKQVNSKRTTNNNCAILKFSDTYSYINEQSSEIWDIFNNMWGIVIIACELLIFRVGRLINLKIISSQVNTEKQDKRSDILTVLFDIDRLSKGIYKEELSSVGFYYKNKLPQSNI